MNRKTCKQGFDSYIKNGEKIREGFRKHGHNTPKDQPWTEEQKKFAWRVWQVAWTQGKIYGNEETKEALKIRKPLSDEEMRDLWIKCGIGKEFGKLVEHAHGIRKRI